MKPAIAVIAAALVLALSPAVARADLCPKCKDGVYIQTIGTCAACGGTTTSGAFKLCRACSAKLGECEHCRAKLVSAAQGVVLVLDEQAAGKTIAAAVGRRIEVRLPGNPTTGYTWVLKSIGGDAVRSLGDPAFVRPAEAEPRVGAGGTFVFSLLAEKPGTAEVTFIYVRPWERDKAPAKTFAVTFDVRPGATAERARALKADLASFVLRLVYSGEQDKPFYALVLHVGRVEEKATPFFQVVTITEAQASRIIDHLAADGFLSRVGPPVSGAAEPCYILTVQSKSTAAMAENLGWDARMLARLDGLRSVLDGDAATAMDFLLGRLGGLRQMWTKAAPSAPKQ
jgi:inhibitor of cysteine peptidase